MRAARIGFCAAALALGLAASPSCRSTVDGGGNGDGGRRRDMGANPGGDGFIDFVDMARNTTSCVGGGSVCASGNPGKCDPGIVTCDGEQAMCTPDSMVQDCYDGPPGTIGVGVCQSGAQSCIGILGPCMGQILPAAKEDCLNDLDDDCNGQVNDGCPDSIGVGVARLQAPYVGANGNAGAMDLNVRCPSDAFVTGLTIEFMDAQLQVAGLRLTCGKATLTRTMSGYTATVQNVAPVPFVSLIAPPPANGTGTPIGVSCTGIGLRALSTSRGSYDVRVIGGDQVGGIVGYFGKCGLATPVFNAADNTLSFTVAEYGTEAGYDYGAALTSDQPVNWGQCQPGEVTVGFNGRVSTCGQISPGVPGACLDKLQPACAALVTRYKM